jgi:hypothetical protein
MKYSREVSLPLFVVAMGISMACAPELCAQANDTNQCSLKITLSNNAAVFSVQNPTTNGNGTFDLFFKTNLSDSEGWNWLLRCPLDQTNLVMSNLLSGQGYFMLGVTNAIRPGFLDFALPPEDDDPSSNATLPFAISYYGVTYSNLFVNNNGNVTFDSSQWAYTPTPLSKLNIRVIAPYWADVDTRGAGSDVVTYGNGTVDGHGAFGVDWVNVGYYQQHTDKLLSCQLVIIERSDIAPGDFDMEFNYYQVQWEWGDVSSGYPARVGYSDGVDDYELVGSGVDGAFQDTNVVSGLIYHNLNSPVPGRYVFYFRDGQPQQHSP